VLADRLRRPWFPTRDLHDEHGDDGTDGEHVGQETEQIGLTMEGPNVAEVTLPVVVLLQEVEKGSGVGREAGSANAPSSTRGMYIPSLSTYPS
jgi:hypothetical protein